MTIESQFFSNQKTRSGFVAIIGAPNAGKSTLMNFIVGAKVSIVTPKVQTTRTRIKGIAMVGDSQIIFIDTPGIFAPKRRLDRAMVNAAWQGTDEADIILLLHDSARSSSDEETANIINRIENIQREFPNRKFALILNKIDLVKPENLLGKASKLSKIINFEKIFLLKSFIFLIF